MYTNILEVILYNWQKTSKILFALQTFCITGLESNNRMERNCDVQ